MSEEIISKPIIGVQSGDFDVTQIVEINHQDRNARIYFSTDGSIPSRIYCGAFAVTKSGMIRALAKIENNISEEAVAEIKIVKKGEAQRGTVVIIGGAEHCLELHKKIIDRAGGPEKARIAFIPTSSANPYAGGMERLVRFRELGGLKVDESLVPETGGKKDYSSLDNNSNFWIVPIALLDDDTTGSRVSDDTKQPLVRESSFPDIDESKWSGNGHLKQVAEKLRDGGYNIIFLTGGNQARYLQCLLYDDNSETPVLTIIREILEERKGIIAGTSAGAAILSKVMIQGGGSYGATMQGVIYKDIDLKHYEDKYTPFEDENDGRVWLGRGLGFLPENIITGTHFIVRGRVGRLMTASLYLKSEKKIPMIGIGVGEDTAVFAYPDNTFEVAGAGGVLILDASRSVIFEGNPEKGKMYTTGMVMHYLEQGDHFHIDESGEVITDRISELKTELLQPEFKGGDHYYIEHDIFGSKVFKKFVFQSLVKNEASHCMGLEMIDNTEESYDSILFHDIVKDDTVLFMFSNTEKTRGYEGTVKYSWWGRKDMDYPNLKQETETKRFSFQNVFIETIPINLLNFPAMDDARDIPLKKHYLARGYSEEEWYRLFDAEKKFYFGIMALLDEESIKICTVFFDYAYHDVDGNRRYSPPRYASSVKDPDYNDYDIVEINPAAGSHVTVDGVAVGETDCFGLIYHIQGKRPEQISAVFTGKKGEYTVNLNLKDIQGKAFMIFSDRSW
ncbi:MAG: chitobiase/beta-hexosaminidase C-terminal domain-containing protein [Bacteroidota bacterium]